MPSIDRVREIQRLYPLLYFACHGSHARADGLGESDLRLLHHIEGEPGTYASQLARHLDLSRSRMSEALAKLERADLIERSEASGGRKHIRLTDHGISVLESGDGLDPTAIEVILDRLAPAQQDTVIEGLRLLASAVRAGDP